ncbi:bifunctional lysylphosphatidylglycerol flippase/synthetase MprF [Gorillibacterium timonense]|uniref:bifunctional lysylphosphatidylglycerol flippase/synthetase MprF n=1 Tax=Gorillibacterium timonense TaxID=1689269 RepID=UPI00071CCD89|nr:bifunctional lysylphosphatidylglycerol flippase/synthetase MprF [Gorillibacterium timonense]
MKEKLERFAIFRLLVGLSRTRAIRLLIPIAVIALVYIEGSNELKQIHIGQTIRQLRGMPRLSVLAILGTALFSVAVMSGYDFLIRHHFRLNVSRGTTFRYSWIANTFNNILGFAGLTGAGVRTLLYKRSGVPAAKMGQAVLFLSPMVITGLSVLSWFVVTGVFPAWTLFEVHPWLQIAVYGVGLYLVFFIGVQRSSLFAKWFNRDGGRIPFVTVGASLGASFLEWSFAAMTFFLITRELLGPVPFCGIIGLYVVSAVAGILSMAPGGIGAFDLTVLMGLQIMDYSSDQAMAVLVMFRLFYYVVPWLVGLLLGAFEFATGGRRKADRQPVKDPESGELFQESESVSGSAAALANRLNGALNAWQKFWRLPEQLGFLTDFGAWALGKLVLIGGFVLLLSAATPGLMHRLRFTKELLSLPVMQLSHQLTVIIGFLLILLSRGISLRVKRAYRLTSLLLWAGAVFSFTKAFDFEEAIYLLIVALMLWISRDRFYREGAPLSGRLLGFWFLTTTLIAVSYYLLGSHMLDGFIKHLPMKPRHHAAHALQPPHYYAITAAVGLVSSWLFLTVILLLRPFRHTEIGAGVEEMARLEAFLKTNKGNYLTHMYFTGDKGFYWAKGGKVLFVYAKTRDKLAVLGDPLGPRELISEAIVEFQQYADRYALSVVFYQVGPEYLSIYHDNGYRFFKLGEEALVDLDAFTLSGKKNTDLRAVNNRFEREGYAFEIAQPPHNADLLSELREVSTEWLDGKKEMGYSLGWFDEPYLQRAPLAVLRSSEGRALAFASLAPVYDGGRTMSIDLMRHRKDTPNGTMDWMFIRLLQGCKEQGYARFNLGNAPLASVGQSKSAMREERLASLVFRYGGHWYGFQGLRRYKGKFSPDWEPRFLAYPVTVSLPILTVDLVRLVNRKMKGSR